MPASAETLHPGAMPTVDTLPRPGGRPVVHDEAREMPDNTNRDSPVTAAPSDRRPLADGMKECLAVPTEKSSECYAEKLMEELDVGFEPPMRRWNRDEAWGLITHDEATEWVHLAVLALYVD